MPGPHRLRGSAYPGRELEPEPAATEATPSATTSATTGPVASATTGPVASATTGPVANPLGRLDGVSNQMLVRLLANRPAEPGEAGDDLADRIRGRLGHGERLPAELRADLEGQLAGQFSGVRVHRDAAAAALADELSARAFTAGSDIFFSPGAYDPSSTPGYTTLAHELVHTQQEGSSAAGRQVAPGLSVSAPGDRDERAAATIAQQVVVRRASSDSGDQDPIAASAGSAAGPAGPAGPAAGPAGGRAAGPASGSGGLQVRREATPGTGDQVAELSDPTTQSITSDYAKNLSDVELAVQLRRVETALASTPADPAIAAAQQQNLRLLSAERERRAGGGAQVVPTDLPRPPGLPANGAFQLVAVTDLPPGISDAMPEGQLMELVPGVGLVPAGAGAQLGGEPPDRSGSPVAEALEAGGTGSFGAIAGGNAVTTRFGFAAAGENAVGLVAIPRIQPPFGRAGSAGYNPLAGLNPNANPIVDLARPMDAWGHTAMYLRRGGQIAWARGFGPDMGLAQLPGFVAEMDKVGSGKAAWPGVVENDLTMFRSTMARSIEYPIPEALAETIVGQHPAGPGGTGGSPPNYTARPNVFAASRGDAALMCTNQNCVMYAVEQLEGHLGGPVGRLGKGSTVHAGGPGSAGQGPLYRLMADADAAAGAGRPSPLTQPPNALGPAVPGRMPVALRYIKWGGRVFVVVGIAAGIWEVAAAPADQQSRTAMGVAGGLAGGFLTGAGTAALAGATAGLVCGPGAPVCSLVFGISAGLVGGVLGALGGRALAEYAYDSATASPAQPATSHPAVAQPLPAAGAGQPGQCPSCHRQLQPALVPGSFDQALALSAGMSGGGRQRQLAPDELLLIMGSLR